MYRGFNSWLITILIFLSGISSNLGKVQRPKLAMEIGGKIPHMLRQRYLDKIIDEIIPKCASEKEAFEKV